MSQEFFKHLPLELINNILLRLPLRAIATCKCVCKPWVDLITTREFANSHLSSSAPALLFNPSGSVLRIFELEDRLDLDHHSLHYNPLTEFQFPREPLEIKCSANGLLLLRKLRVRITDSVTLFICNPITRDYIELQGTLFSSPRKIVTYGFGPSRTTGQYKVVRVIHNRRDYPRSISKSECHVYTVGTGLWRSIEPGPPLDYICISGGTGPLLNGNVHWFVCDSKGSIQISCFDLELEFFTMFCAPPISHYRWAKSLCVLEGCLSLCDNLSNDEIVIWSMKEYGDEKSWTKELVIEKTPGFIRGLLEPEHPINRSYCVHPLKVFKDGDVLMMWDGLFFLYYSNKTKITQRIDMQMLKPPSGERCAKAVLHNPSFLSLKFFPMENVSSF